LTDTTFQKYEVDDVFKWRNFFMKATGIVRRIDDLGRVVIPKEIRRTLRLREGTPLEIFTDREGEIILKKYSPMVELASFATQYAESLAQASGYMVCITDRDQIIAVAGGPKKELLQKNISKELEHAINEREQILAQKDDRSFVSILDEEIEGVTAEVIAPIISEGDAIGAVALLSRETRAKMGDTETKLVAAATGFLGRQMES
jgi:AbrB family transcriptional regulator (stage V sporulation protein T)